MTDVPPRPRTVIVFPRLATDPDPLTRWTLATVDRYARRWGCDIKTLTDSAPDGTDDATILAAMSEAAREEGYGLVGRAAPGFLWALPQHPPDGTRPLAVAVASVDEARELAVSVYPDLADPDAFEAAVTGVAPPPPPGPPSREPWTPRYRIGDAVAMVGGLTVPPAVGYGLSTCAASA